MPRRRAVLAAAAAFALTCLSCGYERRGPELVVVGNLCGPSTSELCYEPALKGGFPLPYIYDSPAASVQGQLSLAEDKLRPGAFAIDVLFYFVILLAAGLVVRAARGAAFSAARSRGP